MRNFSPRASRLVYALCQDEARNTGSNQILPEHILLALLKSADGLGYYLLQKLNINLLSLRTMLEQSIEKGSPSENLDFDIIPTGRRTKTVLDIASMEAQAMENNYVGTEHIVLACIRENARLSDLLLTNAQVSIQEARDTCKKIQAEKASSTVGKKAEELANLALRSIFGETNHTDDFVNFVRSAQDDNSAAKKTPQDKKKARANIGFVEEFSRDITKLAREKKIDPVVGREKEIERLIQILSRRTKNNPVLVGEPGVGKTAIVEGLAYKIALGQVPMGISSKRILSLDLAAMVAGTKFRGEFEERMKKMMAEVKEDPSIILFIDELHTIIGAGGPEGQMDASNMLKPALSRGEIQIIGATTTKEYTRYIEKDSALERRFQQVRVEEPGDQDTVQILLGIKKQYEDFHGVIYEDDVIPSIVKLTRRYIPERFLPDKAIDLLDEAGAQKKIKEESKPTDLILLEKQIEELAAQKAELVRNQDYEKAAYVRDKVIELKRKLEIFSDLYKKNGVGQRQHVTCHDVCKIICSMTGIPVDQLDTAEASRLVNMEDEMHKMVIGQDDAVHLISGAVRRNRAGISSSKHPIGSFIFLGPTGVGKTQLAKALAKFLFGNEDQLIRIDMSDYMEKHNASRLVGAPPGYVGYEDGGVLTEKVRRHPYSVVLLDEIEKAHPDVFNLLLQILEEGELSDNLGHTINFRNTVIIMTSNAGARQITSDGRIGFSSSDGGVLPYQEIRSNAMNELKKLMNPELINRIDDIIVFDALNKKQIGKILDIQISELASRLAERGISINIKPKAREYLISNGYDPAMGARPMRRLIQREIEDPVSIQILEGKDKLSKQVSVDCLKDGLRVRFITDMPEETTSKIGVTQDGIEIAVKK
ncbi:MAG: ATP-dependent Clp protease ATP-binding subunit [Treponema sp.]|nr:ATP-dependent Clp protease ATP-binding subunit [Treponema sp.]